VLSTFVIRLLDLAELNDIISELSARFSSDTLSLLELSGGLSPANNFEMWDRDKIVKLAESYYCDDFPDIITLGEEVDRLTAISKSGKRFKDLKTTEDLCPTIYSTDNQAFFPSLHRLVQLICVLPSQDDRSTMGDSWMSNLMLLAMERDLTNSIDKDEVIDAFNALTTRRIPMQFKPSSVFQALSELFALDLLVKDPVISLLTGLADNWQFFWISEGAILKAIIKEPGEAFQVTRTLLAQSLPAGTDIELPCFQEP
ncbi:hypothetical protein GN958_ATG00819, partial [Phytophthora infestans]